MNHQLEKTNGLSNFGKKFVWKTLKIRKTMKKKNPFLYSYIFIKPEFEINVLRKQIIIL